jgi:spermidine synthase
MTRIAMGLFFTGCTTLMLELTLIRIFDVIWYANMAYMVITLAMFCFGMAGVYSAIRPFRDNSNIPRVLASLSLLLGLTAFAILPMLNWLPFNFEVLLATPKKGIFMFLVMYLFLAMPFFFAGMIFTLVFSRFSERIQTLYFWDLFGAALGCVIIIPLLPLIGPGGLLFLACGFGLLSSALFSENRWWSNSAILAGVIISIIPFTRGEYFEFHHHINKRGVKSAQEQGKVERSYWDPVSRIDVISLSNGNKHVAYDGGTQSSFIYPFDGDYQQLRADLPDGTRRHFGGQHVYISHHLKQDSDQDVLVIGSAAGQETKAALAFGARSVDAIELVGYVVKIGKEDYADFNGNIFNHPRVNALVGEGRSYLRGTTKKYDIIQIFSNHTSSSIAAGTGAMATTYLQTKEAYQEYFSHLTEDGILHINHHIYPKMITTAALAWQEMGLSDFRRHVVVFQAIDKIVDTLPTMLIRMTPWTEEEMVELRGFFHGHTRVVEDPLAPEKSFLSDDFYSGTMPKELLARMEYRAGASTDDRPYFNFLRKNVKNFSAEPGNYMTYSTAAILNRQVVRGFIPKDVVHLFVTGGAALFFTVAFLFIPLLFSRVGREPWQGKICTLLYFSCLGAGFIIFELIFIQIFMKLIGYPLYTYSTVLFVTLFAAAVGSYCSGSFGITPQRHWSTPFAGVICSAVLMMLFQQQIFEIFLQNNVAVRIAIASLLLFPIGFFMGMPFPLGILAIEKKPRGAIAWAWAMNGLFTVIGGILSVVLSIYYGFQMTLLFAMMIYVLAWVLYARLRTSAA